MFDFICTYVDICTYTCCLSKQDYVLGYKVHSLRWYEGDKIAWNTCFLKQISRICIIDATVLIVFHIKLFTEFTSWKEILQSVVELVRWLRPFLSSFRVQSLVPQTLCTIHLIKRQVVKCSCTLTQAAGKAKQRPAKRQTSLAGCDVPRNFQKNVRLYLNRDTQSFFYECQESTKTIKQTKMFQNWNSVCKRLHFLFSAMYLDLLAARFLELISMGSW